MGCESCGRKSTTTYPREAVMPDGTRVTVTSASDEREKRDAVAIRMRRDSPGWTAR